MTNGTATFLSKSYKIITWTGQKLVSPIAIDTETELIKSPDHIPELVTCQAYDGGENVYFITRESIRKFFNKHYTHTFIMHNAAFDISVLEHFIGKDMVFDLYDSNLVLDTSILYRLLVLAIEGETPFKYNLSLLSKIFLGQELDKESGVRTNFEQFLGKQLSDIPPEYLEYAALDVIATRMVYDKMMPHILHHDSYKTLLSHHIQIKGELGLRSIERNGIIFNTERGRAWLAEKDNILQALMEKLANWGWVRGLKGNSKKFEDIMQFLGVKDKLPLTESGEMSKASDDLEPFRHHGFINDYLTFMEIEKATSFVRDLI